MGGRAAGRTLIRFMLLSIAASVATIAFEDGGSVDDGSVGSLSDAFESGVNLVTALVALWAFRLAAKPPDEGHQFGHGQASTCPLQSRAAWCSSLRGSSCGRRSIA